MSQIYFARKRGLDTRIKHRKDRLLNLVCDQCKLEPSSWPCKTTVTIDRHYGGVNRHVRSGFFFEESFKNGFVELTDSIGTKHTITWLYKGGRVARLLRSWRARFFGNIDILQIVSRNYKFSAYDQTHLLDPNGKWLVPKTRAERREVVVRDINGKEHIIQRRRSAAARTEAQDRAGWTSFFRNIKRTLFPDMHGTAFDSPPGSKPSALRGSKPDPLSGYLSGTLRIESHDYTYDSFDGFNLECEYPDYDPELIVVSDTLPESFPQRFLQNPSRPRPTSASRAPAARGQWSTASERDFLMAILSSNGRRTPSGIEADWDQVTALMVSYEHHLTTADVIAHAAVIRRPQQRPATNILGQPDKPKPGTAERSLLIAVLFTQGQYVEEKLSADWEQVANLMTTWGFTFTRDAIDKLVENLLRNFSRRHAMDGKRKPRYSKHLNG